MQISPNPATLAFTEIFSGINSRPCGKDHNRLHVIISMEQKILPIGAGGEKGENFLQAKTADYIVLLYTAHN